MVRYYWSTIVLAALLSCGPEQPAGVDSAVTTRPPRKSTAVRRRPLVSPIPESDTEADTSGASELAPQLRTIRANFKWLNSISEWPLVTRHQLDSGEGGELTAYWYGRQPDKMLVRRYGETYQALTEYYLLRGELSFVFEKVRHYNRPIYYGAKQARQNHDDQAFDIHKSELEETRSYFSRGQLIHQIRRPVVSPTDRLRRTEQQRLLADFTEMLRLGQLDYRAATHRPPTQPPHTEKSPD